MSTPTSAAPFSSVVCDGLSFSWPDGTPVFTDFSCTFGTGRLGLIGVNGSGKSTLLSLIAGARTPQSGSVTVTGHLGYVRQDVGPAADLRVDDVLGIADIRGAIRAIEAGDSSDCHFETVGSEWDVDERARATLDQLGLAGVELDRRVGHLSGGQSVLLSLAAELLRAPEVLLLDEPTNNLDAAARSRLYEAVQNWRGTILIVSHDRELLGLVDQIGDLRDGEVRWYGGNWDDYARAIEVEQEAAERLVRVAEQDVRRQKRELIEAQTTLERRVRYGQKMWDQKREPKIVMGNRKRAAQVSAGKHRNLHQDKLEQAQERLTESEQALRADREIRIELPATAVPAGRMVLTLRRLATRSQAPWSLELRGAERVALIGRNGSGKSTLLDTIAGRLAPVSGEADVAVPLRYLPQRLTLLDPALTVAENVARYAPTATPNELRARLARFLFRGRKADQLASSLSGGERFRATLAALLLAEPAPQLLLLDEPTNNLDLASVRELTSALEQYRGALIVASHDRHFLAELGITRWLDLDASNDGDPS